MIERRSRPRAPTSSEQNARRLQELVTGLLGATREWKSVGEVEAGSVMVLPDGSRRLVVTRLWTGNGDNVMAANAARYADVHGGAHGGAVLGILSTLSIVQRAVMAPHLANGVELLDERTIVNMATAAGTRQLLEYECILRHTGFGRRPIAA